MTRYFPVPQLNSQRRSSSFAKLLAAAVISSSVGLSASPQAMAQSSHQSHEIRQVAGSSRSGGLFSGIFGGGSDDGGPSKEPYRKATPVPSDREVNWSGIPFHNPNEGRTASSAQTPIRDPGAGNRGFSAPQAPRPTSNTAPRSAVPTPPQVATSTPRKLTNPVESGAAAHISSSGRPEPLSVTQSSRRPPNLEPRGAAMQLESTRPALVSKPNAIIAAVDVKPVELVPKVSRKVIKSASTAVVAKLADAPDEETVATDEPGSSQDSESMADATPRRIETPEMDSPQVARHDIPSAMPASLSPAASDVASDPSPAIASVTPSQLGGSIEAGEGTAEQEPSAAVVATSPTATLGTPMLARRAADTDTDTDTNANAGVALHPISDRLPIDDVNDSADIAHAQQDAPIVAQGDAFAPRAQTASGTTMPNYRSTGFGHNEIGEMPAESGSGIPAPTIDVAPNSNMTTMELPVIRVLTAGPRQVTIRQTHTYEIRVENRGSVSAEGLVVRAHIPDWADVVSQQASRGDVAAATENQIRNLNWQIERLDAGQSETLNVRLKASRSGTHDLDVDWTLAPQKRVVQVTVQEPRLALTIDGPDEVVFGESKTYRIRVLNSGDGIAPEVVFTLSPESSSPQSQRIGDIPAGKEAQFEVELTAQDLGELKIHGLAAGDLDLKAEADKTVRVLAADLEAVLTGPEVKYQDTEAVYQLELTNQGTATSENVVATMQLPVGVTYQGGLEGATMIDNQLSWKIASLSPGALRKYQFQCRMDSTGQHQFAFECKGSAAGHANVSLDTSVEAIADLVLSIVDPAAPAPVGEDVTYQIVIHNRGSKPALDVQAIAQFSTGIEPKQITGHAGKVVTGQVLVEPIPRIEGGQEVRMTIIARAETGGHHRFRTEVRSGDTVLVAEEATHFLAPKTQRITRRSGAEADEVAPPLR